MPVSADAATCLAAEERALLQVAQVRVAPGRARSDPGHRVSTVRTGFRARPWSRDAHAFEIAHAYDVLQIETPASPPQTNGHLHRLGLRYRYAGNDWTAAVGPVIATSSNVGRHPRSIGRSLIDWHGSLRYRATLGARLTGHVGVCRDDRFGSVRFSPLVGVAWQIGETVEASLGWPDSALVWRVGTRWHVRAASGPAGGAWGVYDDDLVHRSPLQRESWRFSISTGFQPTAAHRLGLRVGVDARRSFRYRLDNGDAFASGFERARSLGVEWQWLRR